MTDSFFTRWLIDRIKLRDHEWVEVKFGVRECSRCRQRDYLGERRFPKIDEPRLVNEVRSLMRRQPA